jgi:uncharacterized protein with FMN-binding domain
MPDHSKTPAGRRHAFGLAAAATAFAVATGMGVSGAMAESQRPSKPVTVSHPSPQYNHAGNGHGMAVGTTQTKLLKPHANTVQNAPGVVQY